MYWTTKSGEQKLYTELEDSHILNILKMYIREAIKENSIPEKFIAFQDLWEVAEKKNIELPYKRYTPRLWNVGFHESYLRLPTCAIDINCCDWSEIEEGIVSSDKVEGTPPTIRLLTKNRLQLDKPHIDALIVSYKRWESVCESMEDSFPHHGLGYAWGLH